jgi:subtilisin family serine protease
MDVVNMSLGSSYGNPHILYSQAIQNLVAGGTLVVASAGNSGNNDHIVGAPSTVDEAISVAASVEDGEHN